MTAKNWFFRLFFYVMSLLILALGITLNTKTGLGVSPIISVSYNISELFQLNFGNVTFVYYVLFVFNIPFGSPLFLCCFYNVIPRSFSFKI